MKNLLDNNGYIEALVRSKLDWPDNLANEIIARLRGDKPPRARIITIPVGSDWDGQAMEEDGPIGLRMIKFNRSEWGSDDLFHALMLPDKHELIIRREGRMVYIERPTIVM